MELRKFAHLNSEKKRRCKMNDAFQVLKNKIPSCGLNTNVTKMTILHEGKDDSGLDLCEANHFIILK